MDNWKSYAASHWIVEATASQSWLQVSALVRTGWIKPFTWGMIGKWVIKSFLRYLHCRNGKNKISWSYLPTLPAYRFDSSRGLSHLVSDTSEALGIWDWNPSWKYLFCLHKIWFNTHLFLNTLNPIADHFELVRLFTDLLAVFGSIIRTFKIRWEMLEAVYVEGHEL